MLFVEFIRYSAHEYTYFPISTHSSATRTTPCTPCIEIGTSTSCAVLFLYNPFSSLYPGLALVTYNLSSPRWLRFTVSKIESVILFLFVFLNETLKRTFSCRQICVQGLNGFNKPSLVNEWQQRNALPSKLLSIQIDFEVFRIKVNYRGALKKRY